MMIRNHVVYGEGRRNDDPKSRGLCMWVNCEFLSYIVGNRDLEGHPQPPRVFQTWNLKNVLIQLLT